MNIQEAIEHCEEKIDCSPCGQEHGQLADWLNELVQYKDTGLTPEEIMDGKLLAGWIPVEEQLPEEGLEVLVTRLGTSGPYVTTDEYQDEFGWESEGDVIVWMHLPEPYYPSDN